jgi:hypothetical protein
MSLPTQNLMTLTAASVQGKSGDMAALKGEIQRHIIEIQARIRDAIKCNNNHIIYEINQIFDVKNNHDRALKFVYSAIIDQLEMNGFTVGLNLSEKRNFFIITWISAVDNDELERQKQIFNQARDNFDHVRKLVAQNSK